MKRIIGIVILSVGCLAVADVFSDGSLTGELQDQGSFVESLDNRPFPSDEHHDHDHGHSHHHDHHHHHGPVTPVTPVPPPPPVTPVTPVPPPPPTDACYGLEGAYTGLCRQDGSTVTTPITFSVGESGVQCIAYNSSYFQPVALALMSGAGAASFSQTPGGVAITSATLDVYGSGRFNLRAYNSGGGYWFTCGN